MHWQDEEGGPGFWAVTRYEDCVTVNRDYERFSSAARGTMPFEMPDEDIAQQGLMMLNMDPPLHTRYRRLVNKGFTPRMVRDLEESIHRSTDAIIDEVIEKRRGRLRHPALGRAPPPGDRRAARRAPGGPPPHVRVVQLHGGQRGPRVPGPGREAMVAAMELYAYAVRSSSAPSASTPTPTS